MPAAGVLYDENRTNELVRLDVNSFLPEKKGKRVRMACMHAVGR